MNIVITVNLNGNAYQLEKSGYDALREYLETAARRLEGNPDKDEIVADIEQAIADKFRALLGAHKTVVVAREVAEVIAEMGPVQDASSPEPDDQAGAAATAAPGASTGASASGGGAAAGEPAAGAKRLYKIHEGAMIAGVCNGLAAYFNVDVTIVRILFVVLTLFTWGAGLLLYAVLLFLVPVATTPAEKAAACGGSPSTAEEFIRRAKEGYYEGMKTFHDKQAHREWKRRFKHEMRGWRQNFRREMRENAFRWRFHWQTRWAPQAPIAPGVWIALPFLTLFTVALSLLGLYAVISLIASGVVFGIALPASVPLWVGVVALLVVFNVVIWPLKAMRHSLYYQGIYGPGYPGPFAALWNSVVGIGFVVLAVWLADRFIPGVHAALQELRPQLQHAIDSFRQWWAGH